MSWYFLLLGFSTKPILTWVESLALYGDYFCTSFPFLTIRSPKMPGYPLLMSMSSDPWLSCFCLQFAKWLRLPFLEQEATRFYCGLLGKPSSLLLSHYFTSLGGSVWGMSSEHRMNQLEHLQWYFPEQNRLSLPLGQVRGHGLLLYSDSARGLVKSGKKMVKG